MRARATHTHTHTLCYTHTNSHTHTLLHTHTQALRAQAQDGWLARYLAGGRSRQEVAAVARSERVPDSDEARRTAWARMSLLVLYFNPSGGVGVLCAVMPARRGA
jgi:hypothetical protein